MTRFGEAESCRSSSAVYDAAGNVIEQAGGLIGPVVRRCGDCGGDGEVVLLITRRTCDACGGTGLVRGGGGTTRPAGAWLSERFDALGRVVRQQQVVLEEGPPAKAR